MQVTKMPLAKIKEQVDLLFKHNPNLEISSFIGLDNTSFTPILCLSFPMEKIQDSVTKG